MADAAQPRLLRRLSSAATSRPRDVTRDVCAALDAQAVRPVVGWVWRCRVSALMLGVVAVSYQIATGIGTWGLNTHGRVGVRHHEFRVLDRHRPRRHADLGDSVSAPAALAHLGQPRGRGDDAVCRDVRRHLSRSSTWAGPGWRSGCCPYPNTRGSLWINFRSPLDLGLLCDQHVLHDLRDLLVRRAAARSRDHPRPDATATPALAQIFGWLSLGWNGSYSHLASLRGRLPAAGRRSPRRSSLSVHTIVSMDFATAVVPGWHTTIFPPYFVAGAIFSGMAMVLTLMLVARKTMRLEDYITPRHVDAMCKLVILTSGMVGLAYATEFFTAFYSGNPYEQFAFINRAFGPLAWGYWIMVGCNVLVPQLFWFTRVRRHAAGGLRHLAASSTSACGSSASSSS